MQYDLAHSKTGVLDEDEAQEQKKSQRRRKKKEQKAKQEKLKDMKEAMEKMQQAMAGMQDELSKKKGEWERGGEKEKNDSPHEEAQCQNAKNDDYVSSRPPPDVGLAICRPRSRGTPNPLSILQWPQCSAVGMRGGTRLGPGVRRQAQDNPPSQTIWQTSKPRIHRYRRSPNLIHQ
uniref:Uncharacterized protein n=1 Tax=Bionectria ochroleuca TaxID=29856 RepID=A0A8H7NDU0_BIOOC